MDRSFSGDYGNPNATAVREFDWPLHSNVRFLETLLSPSFAGGNDFDDLVVLDAETFGFEDDDDDEDEGYGYVDDDDAFDRRTPFRDAERSVFSVPRACSICRSAFTINDSYGTFDCACHWGRRVSGRRRGECDSRSATGYVWSCCGNPIDGPGNWHARNGCTPCEHLPVGTNKRYGEDSVLPVLSLPLGLVALAYRAENGFSRYPFLKRYLYDPDNERVRRQARLILRYKLVHEYKAVVSREPLAVAVFAKTHLPVEEGRRVEAYVHLTDSFIRYPLIKT